MAARHYDVIVLGRSLGALTAAALLARREFRVLVLGQGRKPAFYRALGEPLSRRVFTMLGAASPVFRRVLQELAQTQRFRRMTTPLDPMFGVLDDEMRFEIPPDLELFTREIEREMPEVTTSIAELYAVVSEANASMDRAFEQEVVWPPGSLLERLETGRRAALLPFKPHELGGALLERFPENHPMRRVVMLPALFSSHQGTTPEDLSLLGATRLHGFWTRGVHALPRGELDLEEFLVERIESHGGICKLDGRANSILVERGRAVGILDEDDHLRSGADAIVCAQSGEEIAALTGGAGLTKQAEKSWPLLHVDGRRFVVSVLLRSSGLPRLLPREAFLVAPRSGFPDVHLQSYDTKALGSSLETTPTRDGDTLLVLEATLQSSGAIAVDQAREAVLAVLEHYLPFVENHYVLIDSVHDGLPAVYFDPATRARREMDRIHLKETQATPEPMDPRFRATDGYLGLASEPVRGPVPGTYLVGPSVLPALGQEGELLAAQGVARILTRRDRERQKLRKRMWTKIETI